MCAFGSISHKQLIGQISSTLTISEVTTKLILATANQRLLIISANKGADLVLLLLHLLVDLLLLPNDHY